MGCGSSVITDEPNHTTGGSLKIGVCIWDFDDTLVPWYKMKRDDEGKFLWDDWVSHCQSIQQEHLQGDHDSWKEASTWIDLPPELQGFVRNIYKLPRAAGALIRPGAKLEQLEMQTEACYGGWLQEARTVLQVIFECQDADATSEGVTWPMYAV